MPKPSPRVSIVDDEPSVRNALARLLRAQSFDVETFSSAAEFIGSLGAAVPDCLVVDFHMPEMTGLELQNYLQRADIFIPTIVITAHDDASVRRLCEVGGASAFLVKPLSNSVLIAAIERAVGSERVPVV